MQRRDFLKDSLLAGAALTGGPALGLPAVLGSSAGASPLAGMAASIGALTPLMGGRFVTLCIMIRTSPWEVSRDVKLIDRDEYFAHELEVVRGMREAFAKNNSRGRLTWGFTLNALEPARGGWGRGGRVDLLSLLSIKGAFL